MRPGFTLIFVAGIMAAGAYGSAAKAANAGLGQVWKLEQKSCTAGSVTLYVGNSGLKWSCAKLGITVITSAPDWDVVAYNDNNKKFMELNSNQIEKLFGKGKETRQKLQEIKASKDFKNEKYFELVRSSPKICGMRTLEYHIPKDRSKFGKIDPGRVDPFVQKELDAESKKSGRVYDQKKWKSGDEDFWVAADIFLPKAAGIKLGWDMHEPHAWLRSVHIGDGGQYSMSFDTVTCKKVAFAPDLFKIPKGYSKTANEMTLMMGIEDEDMDILAGPESRSHKNPVPELGRHHLSPDPLKSP